MERNSPNFMAPNLTHHVAPCQSDRHIVARKQIWPKCFRTRGGNQAGVGFFHAINVIESMVVFWRSADAE
jgi:hypothetical protein